MKTPLILALALSLAGCATGFRETQSSAPYATGQTSKAPDAFVGCFTAKAPTAVEAFTQGDSRIVHYTPPGPFDMTGYSVTVTPTGKVELRQGMYRAIDDVWTAVAVCL